MDAIKSTLRRRFHVIKVCATIRKSNMKILLNNFLPVKYCAFFYATEKRREFGLNACYGKTVKQIYLWLHTNCKSHPATSHLPVHVLFQ